MNGKIIKIVYLFWKTFIFDMISRYKGNEVCKNCIEYSKCRGGCRARVLESTGELNDVDPLCPLRQNLLSNIK